MKDRLLQWFKIYGSTKQATRWLSVISFTESSFFPIPPDPFMVAMLFIKKNSWWKLALNVTISSVLGGLFGYFLGAVFFDFFGQPIIDTYGKQADFENIIALFQTHGFVTVFTAAFTPIPYKIFTLASGFANVSLVTFILASFFGRGIRFFLVAGIMHVFGERFGKLLVKYFNIFCLVVVLLGVAVIFMKITT
jgi:membrane protein YqaA with SNARE-associated domain